MSDFIEMPNLYPMSAKAKQLVHQVAPMFAGLPLQEVDHVLNRVLFTSWMSFFSGRPSLPFYDELMEQMAGENGVASTAGTDMVPSQPDPRKVRELVHQILPLLASLSLPDITNMLNSVRLAMWCSFFCQRPGTRFHEMFMEHLAAEAEGETKN